MIQHSVLKRLVFQTHVTTKWEEQHTFQLCCHDDEARCWVYSKHTGAPQGSNGARMIMEYPQDE